MDRQKNVINQIDIKEHQSLIIEHFKNFDDSYFNKNSSSTLLWQSELIIKNHDDDFIIGSKSKFNNLIEIFIKAKDSPGLFYKLLKVLEHAGLEVIDANIFTDDKLFSICSQKISSTSYALVNLAANNGENAE